MTRQLLAETCLGQPEAVEDFPFGDHVSVFKVGGKMFALLPMRSVSYTHMTQPTILLV